MASGTTLYLRGLPTDLVREAKATAARRGITLAGLVAEALGQILGLERPAGSGDDLARSLRWYKRNRGKLLRRYRGEYVAIRGGRVIDHDRDFHVLASRVFARLGPVPVFMPRVTAEERVIHLPSPLLAES